MNTIFLKAHLKEDSYIWNSNPNFNGHATRRAFNRYDGEQMLFIINLWGATVHNFTIEEGQKMESLIYKRLPLEPQSEITVLRWLMDNSD